MTTYALLVTVYFLSLGVERESVGVLLWPAAIVHGAETVLLARELLRRRRSMTGS